MGDVLVMSETDAEFLARIEQITSWREIDDKSERDRLFAIARRGADAAEVIERLRAALGNVSRMKVFPDAAINQTTLAAAIQIARAALGEQP